MIILDTHVFIWLSLDRGKISKKAQTQITRAGLSISDITFLETANLVKKKRLVLSCQLTEFLHLACEALQIKTLAMTPEIVDIAVNLPDHINSDPADRIIAATAINSNSILITKDQNLLSAPEIPTCW